MSPVSDQIHKAKPMRKVILISLLISLSMMPHAMAVDWSAGDKADINAVELFFNELETYQTQFVQTSPEGLSSKGWLWLERPRHLRVEYAPPTNLLIVANGTFLIFVDRDIDQISRYSYETGPFRFLLKEKIDFTEDMIVNTIVRETGLLRLKLVDEDDPRAGSVILSFREAPMALAGWTVIDSNGSKTEVSLHNPSSGLTLPKKLFRFTAHDETRRDYRYGAHE